MRNKIVVISVSLLILINTSCTGTKYDEFYNSFSEEFDIMNSEIINLPDDNYFFIEDETLKNANAIYSFDTDVRDKQRVELSEQCIKSLNTIKDNSVYDFSFIVITEETIYYAGIGEAIYAYSKDGETPTKYCDGSSSFKAYRCADRWYILVLK